ncbi:TonB-dependent receptor [bacterium]|nr:MAG: TonB-dependent receptor [bacterium]
MNFKRLTLVTLLCIALVSMLGAQTARQTGVVRGVVTDTGGEPLPGMTITATSPAMQGSRSDVSNSEGSFRLTGLPPGTYVLTCELPGFKTLRREGLIVQVGQIVTINLQTEPSTLNEELTITAAAPTVDVQSTKIGGVVTTEMIQRLPLNRNLTSIFDTVAGAAGTQERYTGSLHGGQVNTIAYEVDGANSNDPAHGGLLLAPQYDAMEEIEITSGGLPAQVGATGGSFVNIVTKSGGNEFHGQVQTYYTKDTLAEVLFSDNYLKAVGRGKPTAPIKDFELSGTLGGPIIKDKLWFFGDIGRRDLSNTNGSVAVNLGGKQYDPYPAPDRVDEGFLKLTAQFSKKLRFFVMGEVKNRNWGVFYYGGYGNAPDSNFTLKNNTWVGSTANLTWLVSPNTFVDVRAGYVNRWYPITEKNFGGGITYYDEYTGWLWGGVNSWESYITRRNIQSSVRLTHFQDNVLGGDHEFGAGFEFINGMDRYGYARSTPINWILYDGNPYYWRGLRGLNGPDPVNGDGLLAFTSCSPVAGGNNSYVKTFTNRMGGYIQDAWTIKNRLTINLGIRLDNYSGWVGNSLNDGAQGLAFQVGESLQSEIGFNPFGPFELAPIKGLVNFTTFQPRLGLTYDLFGNGKTALKVSVSSYAEAMPVEWFSSATPTVMGQWEFNWFDLNNNGQLDAPGIDKYVSRSGNGVFSRPDPVDLASRVDKNLKTPTSIEYVASINHELFKNFALKVQYIHKEGKNEHGWARYDRASRQYWYKYEQKPEWYVPFTTTVPAIGNYPAQEVTAYFFNLNSPWNNAFWLQQLMPESTRKYDALEVTFDKRYSNGWALGGSVVLSKSNTNSPYPGSIGDNANEFTNGYGRDVWEEPFAIKLYGSFDIPFGLIGSFFFRHATGTPFNRTVTIAAPQDWAAANNALAWDVYVQLEPRGARRNPPIDNLDVRLEKEFKLPFGKVGLFADVYNLLGNKYTQVGENPGGYWQPDGPNTGSGSYAPDYYYGKVNGLRGVRIYKLSIRYSF